MERKKSLLSAALVVAACLCLVAPPEVFGQVASTSACSKWINTEAGNAGTVEWMNVAGAQCDADEARAYTRNVAGLNRSHALVFNNFGLAVPLDASVLGIELTLVRRSANGFSVTDRTVQLSRNGMPAGVNQPLVGKWDRDWSGVTYGGPKDTWGAKWTPAELNSTSFGMVFDADIVGPDDRAEIDQVIVTVYYQAVGMASKSTAPGSKYVCAPFRPAP